MKVKSQQWEKSKKKNHKNYDKSEELENINEINMDENRKIDCDDNFKKRKIKKILIEKSQKLCYTFEDENKINNDLSKVLLKEKKKRNRNNETVKQNLYDDKNYKIYDDMELNKIKKKKKSKMYKKNSNTYLEIVKDLDYIPDELHKSGSKDLKNDEKSDELKSINEINMQENMKIDCDDNVKKTKNKKIRIDNFKIMLHF